MRNFLLILIASISFQLSSQTLPDKFVKFSNELDRLSFDKKIKKLNEAIEENPNEAWYFWFKAGVYDMMGKNEETIQNYEKAISIDPKFSGAYASLARFLYSKDDSQLDVALGYINKAIEFEPDGFYYYIDRGYIYFGMKNYEKALVEANYTSSLSDIDRMPVIILIIKILHAWDKKEELKKVLKSHDLSQEGEFLGTDFCLLLASIYEENDETEKACTLLNGAADSFLMMEEEVPSYLIKELKKCK